MSTREWNNFFVDAGIPKNVAAQYASSFTSNRMTFDMLMDLNKEYLRDLEITVLGDVIAILKHAKTVQNKRTTEKVLKTENEPSKLSSSSERRVVISKQSDGVKKVSAVPSKIPATSTSQVKSQVAAKPTVSSRLGPPKPKDFESSEKKNIFSRLGQGEADNNDSRSDPLKSPSILRKRISDPITDDLKQILKKPSERTHDKRVSFEGNRSSGDKAPPKKKYLMVRTMANGDQIREFIDPDDPILNEYAITKKSISASTLPKVEPPRKTAIQHNIKDRIGSKVLEAKSSMASDRETREPQRSVKSRLSSPNYTNLRITTSSSSSAQQPKARKRISGPSDFDDEPGRKYTSVSSGDSSIKSRLGARTRISF